MNSSKTWNASWSGKAVGTNKRLDTARGRIYRNAAYKVFLDDLAWTFAAAGATRFERPVTVYIQEHVHGRRDVDSLIKPVLDALERSGVLASDNLVREIRAEKQAKHGGPDRLYVEVTG